MNDSSRAADGWSINKERVSLLYTEEDTEEKIGTLSDVSGVHG